MLSSKETLIIETLSMLQSNIVKNAKIHWTTEIMITNHNIVERNQRLISSRRSRAGKNRYNYIAEVIV